ncbi:hypothetical protein M0802_006146 [Mischocyttarus mexicanus]|nr:hypothetical protein M0802_006146 [Mischocyttarus mexicanus]
MGKVRIIVEKYLPAKGGKKEEREEQEEAEAEEKAEVEEEEKKKKVRGRVPKEKSKILIRGAGAAYGMRWAVTGRLRLACSRVRGERVVSPLSKVGVGDLRVER